MALTKVTGQVINTSTDVTVGVLTVTNTLAVGGTVSIGGTLTYEDVTNIDSVGLITARNGIVVGSGITLSKDGDVFFTGIATGNGSGLTALNASNLGSGTVPTARLGSGTASSSTFLRGDSTFQTVNTDLVNDTSPQLGGNLDVNTKNILFGDSSDGSSDDVLIFGAGSDFKIYHDGGSGNYIDSVNKDLYLRCNLDAGITGGDIVLQPKSGENSAIFRDNGAVELYYDNSKKFETHSNGARVDGVLGVGLDPQSTNSSTYVVQGVASGQCLFITFRSEDGTNTSTNGMLMGLDNNYHYLLGRENRPLRIGANNTFSTEIDTSGHLRPTADNTYDLGGSSRRWRNLYTTDLQLSNEGKSNDVDGTWGDYTIQEGESDLFLINNRSGKKYKFNLTEVS